MNDAIENYFRTLDACRLEMQGYSERGQLMSNGQLQSWPAHVKANDEFWNELRAWYDAKNPPAVKIEPQPVITFLQTR